ncbi:MAG TPA: ABC transporter permease [Thermoanaerobaculia bacterium]|jgi:ABC-2 type transport system permease protein
MNKMFAVFKREYLQAVKKKMFIIMTFLFPILMSALLVVPGLLMAKGMGTKRVAVVDGTGQLRDAFTRQAAAEAEKEAAEETTKKPASRTRRRDLPASFDVRYTDAKGQDVTAVAKPFLESLSSDDKKTRLDVVFIVPPSALTSSDTPIKFYSRSSTDFITQERLSRQANRAMQRMRLTARGLDPEELDRLMEDVPVDAVQLSKSGEEKKGGEANFIIGFVLTALVILPAFIYGLEIMRGIIQEKSDRVVEVLVSSMKPSQLLVGKILGIAAVGLTQVTVWMAMGAFFGLSGAAMAAQMLNVDLTGLLRPSIFFFFVLFFLLAYLTYVCIYAIGGAVCNSEKEAQQLIAPFSMIMMLPWILLIVIITNPDSTVSVVLSLMPVFGPVTMFVRTLVSEPPVWHILLSIAVSIGTIAVFFWATAKIFRVGILSYGKRPTIPELWRWLKVA